MLTENCDTSHSQTDQGNCIFGKPYGAINLTNKKLWFYKNEIPPLLLPPDILPPSATVLFLQVQVALLLSMHAEAQCKQRAHL